MRRRAWHGGVARCKAHGGKCGVVAWRRGKFTRRGKRGARPCGVAAMGGGGGKCGGVAWRVRAGAWHGMAQRYGGGKNTVGGGVVCRMAAEKAAGKTKPPCIQRRRFCGRFFVAKNVLRGKCYAGGSLVVAIGAVALRNSRVAVQNS